MKENLPALTGEGEDREQPGPGKPEPVRGKRLAAAFAVAAVSDIVLMGLEVVPVVQLIVDVVTALLLFLILGRRWAIIPGLIAEAIPGVSIFPFWIMVVAAIAVWGEIKPIEKPKGDK